MSRSDPTERSAKRKHGSEKAAGTNSTGQKRRKVSQTEARHLLSEEEIERLGKQIPESPKNFNNIATLIKISRQSDASARTALAALCGAFSMLTVDGWFSSSRAASEKEQKVVQWLKTRRSEYNDILFSRLESSASKDHEKALSLIMQHVKADLASEVQQWADCWTGDRYFRRLMSSIVEGEASPEVAQTFMESYVNKYDDVKYYTFTVIPQLLRPETRTTRMPEDSDSVVTLIEALDPPTVDSDFSQHFHDYSKKQLKAKKLPTKLSEYQRQAQKAFEAVFACNLLAGHRKSLLRILTPVIVPWLQTPSHFLDSLSDFFGAGGSISLLALDGMYEMMTTYNMDYPDFYTKLYSLLDDDLLHSAHRSRFYRLLDKFLASSHLPAVMIASFIKRLARLTLHGPPGAVVATVPWVYNMLQMHPTCTFMIHREPRTDDERAVIDELGANDPFNMEESDPAKTGAIDSCLWELETLQAHYHPNVASLAKIISQEFRKQSYDLESFLNYSYSGLVGEDLKKEMKKPPVVEFEIPKQIFTNADGDDTLARLVSDIMEGV